MRKQNFDEAVTDVIASLGDPTRRAIYLTVRAADAPLTVAAIAERFGVHPNVARYHLDNLVGRGYLGVTRAIAGPGAGRPAHLYQATGLEVHVDLPAQSFELLARLLMRALVEASSDDAAGVAFAAGLAHGEELASVAVSRATGVAELGEAITATMQDLGFESGPARTDAAGCEYETSHCPFGELALDNPGVVCALDRGLVTGMARAWDRRAEVSLLPHARLSEGCTARITVPTS